jgi:hypothetical protein
MVKTSLEFKFIPPLLLIPIKSFLAEFIILSLVISLIIFLFSIRDKIKNAIQGISDKIKNAVQGIRGKVKNRTKDITEKLKKFLISLLPQDSLDYVIVFLSVFYHSFFKVWLYTDKILLLFMKTLPKSLWQLLSIIILLDQYLLGIVVLSYIASKIFSKYKYLSFFFCSVSYYVSIYLCYVALYLFFVYV